MKTLRGFLLNESANETAYADMYKQINKRLEGDFEFERATRGGDYNAQLCPDGDFSVNFEYKICETPDLIDELGGIEKAKRKLGKNFGEGGNVYLYVFAYTSYYSDIERRNALNFQIDFVLDLTNNFDIIYTGKLDVFGKKFEEDAEYEWEDALRVFMDDLKK